MFRQKITQQLEAIMKEFDTLVTENAGLRNIIKKNDERANFLHTEIKLIKNSVYEIQSNIRNKKVAIEELPRIYNKNTKKIKMGYGWAVENDKIADIKLMHSMALPDALVGLEMSPNGNLLGLACAASVFLYSVNEKRLFFLDVNTNTMDENITSAKTQLLKDFDIKILFAKDNNTIFTDTGDSCIRKWDYSLKSGIKLCINLEITLWDFYRENLVIIDKKSISVLNVQNSTTNPLMEFEDSSIFAHSTSLLQFEGTIILGTRNGKIALLKDGVKKEYQVHSKSVTSLNVNSKNQLISGSLDRSIYINNLDIKSLSLTTIAGPMKHDDYVLNVKACDDNLHFISSSRDSTFRIWDLKKKEMRVLAHQGPIMGLAVHKKRVVTGGVDRKIKFWDLEFDIDE